MRLAAALLLLAACTADRSPASEPHASPALESDASVGCYAPGGGVDGGDPKRIEAAPVGDKRCAVLDGGHGDRN